jgi:general secretion pathway protein N
MVGLLRIGPIALLALLAGEAHAADGKLAGTVGSSSLGVKPGNAAEPGHGTTNPLRVLSLAGLSATRDRPLFSPSRRPPAPPTPPIEPIRVAVPPPPTLPPAISLVGIVTGQDGALAVVRTPGNQVLRLRIGDDVGEWNVKVIEETRLTLTHDARLASFELFKNPPPPAAGLKGAAPRIAPSVAPNMATRLAPNMAPSVAPNIATPAAPNMATAVVAPNMAPAVAPNIPPMGSNLPPPMAANIPNVPTFHDRFWRGPRQIEAQ